MIVYSATYVTMYKWTGVAAVCMECEPSDCERIPIVQLSPKRSFEQLLAHDTNFNLALHTEMGGKEIYLLNTSKQ